MLKFLFTDTRYVMLITVPRQHLVYSPSRCFPSTDWTYVLLRRTTFLFA